MEQRIQISAFLGATVKIHMSLKNQGHLGWWPISPGIGSLVGASCTTQQQPQHDMEVLALQRVNWGRSSRKLEQVRVASRDSEVPSISG